MKIVVALGGNALGNTAAEQLRLISHTAASIVGLIEQGHDVVVAHGNGPQVGMINLAMPDMPFPECGAMSQGYIGYHLQNGIQNELAARGMKRPVATVVTQVLVDENDPAFSRPTKPIGSFYNKEQADELARDKGYTLVEDAGRGYRRVVASPKPIDVMETEVIRGLIDAGTIVIAAGGGGIPVIRKDGKLVGVPAVIDKDFASAKLAELTGADELVILTAVDRVSIHYGKPEQTNLSEMTIADAEKYIAEGHFAPGSMLPKVQACVSFVRTGGKALIASLDNAALALKGESGTSIKA